MDTENQYNESLLYSYKSSTKLHQNRTLCSSRNTYMIQFLHWQTLQYINIYKIKYKKMLSHKKKYILKFNKEWQDNILILVSMKMTVFRNVEPCNPQNLLFQRCLLPPTSGQQSHCPDDGGSMLFVSMRSHGATSHCQPKI